MLSASQNGSVVLSPVCVSPCDSWARHDTRRPPHRANEAAAPVPPFRRPRRPAIFVHRGQEFPASRGEGDRALGETARAGEPFSRRRSQLRPPRLRSLSRHGPCVEHIRPPPTPKAKGGST